MSGGAHELATARVALLLLLRQSPLQNRIELWLVAQRGRGFVHVRPQRLGLGLAPEGWGPAEAFVQHAAERVAIRSPVDVPAPDLLRCEVVERADLTPRVRRGPARRLGDAEVSEVGVAVLVEQHVGRLHIPVHQAAAVSRIERGRHLPENVQRVLGESVPSRSRAVLRSVPSTSRIAR